MSKWLWNILNPGLKLKGAGPQDNRIHQTIEQNHRLHFKGRKDWSFKREKRVGNGAGLLVVGTYQEQPTATACCPAGRRHRWRWRSFPWGETLVRLQARQAAPSPSADGLPFLSSSALCLCRRNPKRSKRWGRGGPGGGEDEGLGGRIEGRGRKRLRLQVCNRARSGWKGGGSCLPCY
jgi:hypothetical protein